MQKARYVGKTVAIGVSLLMLLAGFALPAAADKEDTKTPKENKDEEQKTLFVNLAVLGDIVISCPTVGEINVGDVEAYVGVNWDQHGEKGDVHDDTWVDVHEDRAHLKTDALDFGVCLGGAVNDYDYAQTDTHWEVWVRDYIWNGCSNTRLAAAGVCDDKGIPVDHDNDPDTGVWDGVDDMLDGDVGNDGTDEVDLKVAFFARLQTTFTSTNPGFPQANWDCAITDPNPAYSGDPDDTDPGTTTPDVCQRETENRFYFRNSHQFGGCGQEHVLLDTDRLDPATDAPDPAPTGVDLDTLATSKQVFVDGPAFFALDCVLEPGDDVRDNYALAAETINDGPSGAEIIGTCNGDADGVPDTVCVFEDLPSVVSACMLAKTSPGTNMAAPGLIGEIGMRYVTDPPGCDLLGEGAHSDWQFADGSVVVIEDGAAGDAVDDNAGPVLDRVTVCSDGGDPQGAQSDDCGPDPEKSS